MRRAAVDEIGETVLLPMMREEVERNALALEGRSLADLPGMARDLSTLAALYHGDPRYLLAPAQRQNLVPWLLTAFLAVELERSGWTAAFSLPQGLTFERDGRILHPPKLISALRKGEMTPEAFLALINLAP